MRYIISILLVCCCINVFANTDSAHYIKAKTVYQNYLQSLITTNFGLAYDTLSPFDKDNITREGFILWQKNRLKCLLFLKIDSLGKITEHVDINIDDIKYSHAFKLKAVMSEKDLLLASNKNTTITKFIVCVSNGLWKVRLGLNADTIAFSIIGFEVKSSLINVKAKVKVKDILDDYNNNELNADDKYKTKPLEIEGVVCSIKKNIFGRYYANIGESASDYNVLRCYFTQDDLKTLTKGDNVIIRGICIGKDVDVYINPCFVLKIINHQQNTNVNQSK